MCVCGGKRATLGSRFSYATGGENFVAFSPKVPSVGLDVAASPPGGTYDQKCTQPVEKKNENKTERFEFSFGSCFHPSPPSPASHLVTACPDRPEVVVGWPPGGRWMGGFFSAGRFFFRLATDVT